MARSPRRLLTVLAAAGLASLALASCAPTPEDERSGLRVVASTNVWGDVAQTVGGDAVNVTSIIESQTQDPHEYAASARDLASVAEADVVLVNGGGYDEFAEQLVAGAPQSAIVIDVGQLAPVDVDNEHYWFDLATVRAVAAQLAAAYCELDAANCQAVTANQASFDGELGALQDELAGAGLAGDGVMMTEALPYYLFAEAGFADVTPIELARAVESGSEIPAVALLEADRLLRDGEVNVLALNAQADSAQTAELESTATEADVRVIQFSEVLPAGLSYLEWMQGFVRAIISGA